MISPRPSWLDPTLTGIIAAALAYAVTAAVVPSREKASRYD
jgi:hypothetical protein